MAQLNHLATVPIEHLADSVRELYRADFIRDVAEGRACTLVLPYSFLGSFIVPTLWLAIPHSRNQWMRRMRWLVVAFVTAFNFDIARRTSSTNMGVAYVMGLLSFWAIISTWNVLVWNDAQRDAARVVRRRKKADGDGGTGTRCIGEPHNQHTLRHPKIDDVADSPMGPSSHGPEEIGYEYVWQPFPEKDSFLKRLNWALDITTNFRFVGWNWSISTAPAPRIESTTHIPYGTPVDMSSIPIVTKAGHRRCLTEADFVWTRVRTIATMYLILDFLAVFMTKDPYFILGPDYDNILDGNSLSPHLQHIPFWALRIYRQVFVLAGVLSAVSVAFNANDLAHYYIARYVFPIRGELWQYSSTFGSVRQIPDRGLAGWWGGWWHQTFRMQFAAPATWMIRRGYVTKGSVPAALTTAVVSFAQSGLLHIFASMACIPHTKLWRSPVFFLLQVVGIILQSMGAYVVEKHPPLMLPARDAVRTFNFWTTLGWLHLTAGVFFDDLSCSGLWLSEPVPFSVFRMFGLGFPDDNWWRWDSHFVPRWHIGEHWWLSGIAI